MKRSSPSLDRGLTARPRLDRDLIGNPPAGRKRQRVRRHSRFPIRDTFARACRVGGTVSEASGRRAQEAEWTRSRRFFALGVLDPSSHPLRPRPTRSSRPRRNKRDAQIDNRERVDRRARVNALESLGALGIGATMGCRHSTPRTRGGAALRPRLVPVRAASRDVRDSASSLEAGQLSAHAGSDDSKRPPREDTTVDDASEETKRNESFAAKASARRDASAAVPVCSQLWWKWRFSATLTPTGKPGRSGRAGPALLEGCLSC